MDGCGDAIHYVILHRDGQNLLQRWLRHARKTHDDCVEYVGQAFEEEPLCADIDRTIRQINEEIARNFTKNVRPAEQAMMKRCR